MGCWFWGVGFGFVGLLVCVLVLATPQKGWLRPLFLVRTTLSGLNREPWFVPLFSGTFRASGLNQNESGPDQKFPVRTTLLWSGPDKVVQTGENWYFQNSEKTSPCWFRPLFLVQTTKTWSIPIYFRLPSCMSYPTVLVLQYSALDALLSWGERGVGDARRRSQACRTRSPPCAVERCIRASA